VELNRKTITVILVALIIIVPIITIWWSSTTPPDKLIIESVTPDETDRDGVLIVGAAPGGGGTFEADVRLIVTHDAEQVYSGKVPFRDGKLYHKLLLTEFATGNGDYEFKIIHEDFSDKYTTQLDMVIEEIGLISGNGTGVSDDKMPTGTQPWHSLYRFDLAFKTGFNYFDYTIDGLKWNSIDLGYRTIEETIPVKVEADPENDVKVEMIFENLQGTQNTRQVWTVSANDVLDTNYPVPTNGSYILKFSNENTVTIRISVWENRPVTVPKNMNVDVQLKLGTQTQEDTFTFSKVAGDYGFVRPQHGQGVYDISIGLDNPTAKTGSTHSTITVTDSIILNDLPRGDTSAGEPYTLDRAGSRTVEFDATASFDDGPDAELTVFWFFGSTSDGQEIDSIEGPWDDYSVYEYTYAIGETPDLTRERPYLILKDAYGQQSAKVYVNLNIR
jgi:hypothetical protein